MRAMVYKVAVLVLAGLLPVGGGYLCAQLVQTGGIIEGVVLDATSRQPLSFVSIALLAPEQNSVITGGLTDDAGEFRLENVPWGNYIVSATFVGYQSYTRGDVRLQSTAPKLRLAPIVLSVNPKILDEITVQGDKVQMQMGIDRKVYNVGKNNIATGGSASDVLQQIPSVSVDMDGKVSLRGSEAVNIMIDGKPANIMGNDYATLLRSLPAGSIEAVEIITNPSAKYDPDGMAGMINIVLRKDRKKGVNGSVSAGLGTWWNKYNTSAALNYKTERVNLFVNYGFRYDERWAEGVGFQRFNFPDTTFILRQRNDGMNLGVNHLLRAGADWSINRSNLLNFTATTGINHGNGYEDVHYRWNDSTDLLQTEWKRAANNRNNGHSYDLTTGYRHFFGKKGHELYAESSWSCAVTRTGMSAGQFEFSDAELRQTTLNTELNTTFIGKVDYSLPIGEAMRLETGWKSIWRTSDADFDSDTRFPALDSLSTDPLLDNRFIYREGIHAVYGTFAHHIGNFGWQAGLRLEHAQTNPELVNTQERYPRTFRNAFPSLHLEYKLPENQMLQLNFSRRVNRVAIRSLNPFADFSDPLNIRTGNPDLKPEFINSYELGYQKITRGLNVTATIYYRQLYDNIMRIRRPAENGVSYVLMVNLANGQNLGTELIVRRDLGKWGNILLSANAYRTWLNATNVESELTNAGYNFSGRVQPNLNIPKVGSIQLSYNYTAPFVIPQGRVKYVHALDVGIRHDVMKGRGSLTVNVTDVFDTRRFGVLLNNGLFTTDFNRRRESRVGTVTFTWYVGKQEGNRRREPAAIPPPDMGSGGGM